MRRVGVWIGILGALGCTAAPIPDDAASDGAIDARTIDASRLDAHDSGPPLTPPPIATLDAYGGAVELPIANTTGYFIVSQAYGRDWLVTPDGHAFVSMGVNHVDATGDADRNTGVAPYGEWVAAHYADDAAWTDATVARLGQWTFNTIGAWSDDARFVGRMPRTPILGFAGSGWRLGSGPDVFDPAWAADAMTSAASQIGARADDPYVIGWFLDNELRWGPDWRGSEDLLDVFVALPASAPGKIALVGFARSHFADVAAFNAAFGTTLASFDALAAETSLAGSTTEAATFRHDWAGEVADRYFDVASSAVRAADPNHLVLGCRFVSWIAPPSVVAAAGRHVDVVSVNHYEISPQLQRTLTTGPLFAYRTSTDDWLSTFATLSGRPLIISEFGARAADSGLPNSYPPSSFQVVWRTQAERADAVQRYGVAMADATYLVGIHWFEWVDEPSGGRFDGEDSNWGLVDVSDAPYTTVVERATIAGPMLSYATPR